LQDLVRKTKVNWKAFEGTYLNADQCVAIVNYDAADCEGRVRLLQENPNYASIFCILVANLKQPDHVKYVLVLLEELIEDFPLEQRRNRLDSFVRLSKEDAALPIAPFAALLDMEDPYLQYLAAELAGLLVSAESEGYYL
jgi:V-type H+-transporting ATPase subunit H